MPHYSPLIAMIVVGLVVAFLMGALANRLKASPIVGYLLAGIIVGPFTPGFVGDTSLAAQLAEIGVILLMFGVGLHFSFQDLLSVRHIAIPGALAQIASATLMGMALAWAFGWGGTAGFVFGLALSVASTVVLLRALQSFGLVQTERGRIAIGWLIVEDLTMVVALVLLPALAEAINGASANGVWSFAAPLFSMVLKAAGFIAFMLIVGRRAIPATLHWVAQTGSRELFRLAVLAIALGVAFGAAFVFDVSFALGAFFAGMILGETPLSRRSAEETLPLRDAFAVLFFVSVGMLFDPSVVIERPLTLLATLGIIVLGKSVAAFGIVRLFGYSTGTALTIAASLAQIGEFSFMLAGLGTQLGILPSAGRDLILASAIISIFLNPFIFSLMASRSGEAVADDEQPLQSAGKSHAILVGYGRVGHLIACELKSRGRRFIVIDDQPDIVKQAEADGMEVLNGNALDPRTLEAAGIAQAGKLLITIPEGFLAGAIVTHARERNPDIRVIARAHSDAEVEHLKRLGVPDVVMGEREIAARMSALVGAGGLARKA